MPPEIIESGARETCAGWNAAKPEKLPEPTIWPAMLALGITLLVWGLVTSLVISGIGMGLFAVAMGGWIRDLRYERKRH